MTLAAATDSVLSSLLPPAISFDSPRCRSVDATSIYRSREDTLRTSTAPDPSNASTKPRKLGAMDDPRPIYAGRLWLRALWTVWSVEVRVLSGASIKALLRGAFSVAHEVYDHTRPATGFDVLPKSAHRLPRNPARVHRDEQSFP